MAQLDQFSLHHQPSEGIKLNLQVLENTACTASTKIRSVSLHKVLDLIYRVIAESTYRYQQFFASSVNLKQASKVMDNPSVHHQIAVWLPCQDKA